MKVKLLIIFVFAQFAAIGQEIDAMKINAYVSKAVKEHKIPGLAIGVIQNGDIIFQQGYGVQKIGETERVGTRSLFAIASLSKAFTAAAMGILVDEGKVKWNDKVIQYLPSWKLNDPVVTQMMTIEDLLCHRSGLKTFDGDLLWYGSSYNRDEIISRIHHLPLSYEYRNGFGYQNIMFITAGQVIEKASGMSWDAFVEKKLLKPLGMTKTVSSIKKFDENAKIAMPHLNGKPQELIDYNNSGATAALNSNVVDMLTWAQFWLNQGIHHGDTLLQPKTVRKIISLENPLNVSGFDAANGTHFKGYGMGWFLMDYNGKKVVHHGGGLPGYITKVALVPEDKIGIVILTNDMSSICTAVMYKILDMAYRPDAKRDWSKEFASYAAKSEEQKAAKLDAENAARKTETTPSLELSNYVGTYTDKYYGNATVSLEGKGKRAKLKIVLEPAKELFTGVADHWQDDTFVFQFNDEFLPRGFAHFQLSENKVSGFKIELPNPDFHFSNLNFIKN